MWWLCYRHSRCFIPIYQEHFFSMSDACSGTSCVLHAWFSWAEKDFVKKVSRKKSSPQNSARIWMSGWFPWRLSLIRRTIKEVEQPTKRHTHSVLSGEGEVSGLLTHNPLHWLVLKEDTNVLCSAVQVLLSKNPEATSRTVSPRSSSSWRLKIYILCVILFAWFPSDRTETDLPSDGSNLRARRPCLELLCTNMLSETARTWPSTLTVVETTT